MPILYFFPLGIHWLLGLAPQRKILLRADVFVRINPALAGVGLEDYPVEIILRAVVNPADSIAFALGRHDGDCGIELLNHNFQ